MKRKLVLVSQVLLFFLLLLASLLGLPAQAWAQGYRSYNLEHPVVLVADPRFTDADYSRTVIIASPFEMYPSAHHGFILNRPTTMTLGSAFPENEPSQKIPGKIYVGGPFYQGRLFAVVEMRDGLGFGLSLKLSKGVYVVMKEYVIDQLIEEEANRLEKREVLKKPGDEKISQAVGLFAGKEIGRVRFFNGDVIWLPGQLKNEIERGLWHVLSPEPDLLFGDNNENIWETLLQRAQIKEKTI